MDFEDLVNRLFQRDHFDTQRENEEIALLVRKHPFFLFRSLAVPLTILIFLILLKTINLMGWSGGNSLFDWVAGLPLAIYIIAYLVLVFWLIYTFIEWENDFLTVTNRRIFCQRKIYRFTEETVEAELTRIQDISVRVLSPLATFMGYGDLIISTAGIRGQLAFSGMATPEEVKNQIFSLMESVENEMAEVRKSDIMEKLAGGLGLAGPKPE